MIARFMICQRVDGDLQPFVNPDTGRYLIFSSFLHAAKTMATLEEANEHTVIETISFASYTDEDTA